MPYLLVVLGVVARVLPHTWNFVPLGGIGLYAGAYFRPGIAWAVPLVALLIGDLFLGFYGLTEMLFTYLGFLAGPLVGRILLSRRRTIPRFGAAVFIAATVHFGVSNIGAWLTLYPQTLQGLIDCYVLAIPFYAATLFGDAVFASILFGCHELAARYKQPSDGVASV
jgi:hypothetical protein